MAIHSTMLSYPLFEQFLQKHPKRRKNSDMVGCRFLELSTKHYVFNSLKILFLKNWHTVGVWYVCLNTPKLTHLILCHLKIDLGILGPTGNVWPFGCPYVAHGGRGQTSNSPIVWPSTIVRLRGWSPSPCLLI